MKLTVVDTPGFGDQINNDNWWVFVVLKSLKPHKTTSSYQEQFSVPESLISLHFAPLDLECFFTRFQSTPCARAYSEECVCLLSYLTLTYGSFKHKKGS